MTRRLRFLGLTLLLLAACAQPQADSADQALACIAPEGDAAGAEMPHGFSAPVPISFAPVQLVAGQKRVVYLNRNPRTYVAGIDDAQAGSSSVVSAQSLTSVSLGGFQQGDDGWNGLVECVR